MYVVNYLREATALRHTQCVGREYAFIEAQHARTITQKRFAYIADSALSRLLVG